MNLLLGLSPVLISGYDTVNNNPKRWDVGSRILMILYPAHQLILLLTAGLFLDHRLSAWGDPRIDPNGTVTYQVAQS
jgi:hypothetical protein